MNFLTEREQLYDALAKAFNTFISVLDTFQEEEINQVPFSGSWTPAQVAQHIVLATDGIPDTSTSPSHRSMGALLPKIRPWWEDLNQRFTSPEPLRPDNTPRGKTALLDELQRVRAKDLQIVLEKDLSLICMDFELPTIGYLSRYEWLWFIEMHLKRHIAQLERIKKAKEQGMTDAS